MIAAHRVPAAQFDELARGGGGTQAVNTLRGGQLSKRMLQIRALLEAASAGAVTAEETAAAMDAFAVLAAGQRRFPEITQQVLLYPAVGAWAAHCLAKLRPGAKSGSGATGAGLGQLGAIAASIAVLTWPSRADDSHGPEILVPMRGGQVVLPMVGRVNFDGRSDSGSARICLDPTGIIARTGAQMVRLPSDLTVDGPGWRALRRLRAGESGTGLRVCLDDEDPFREYPGLALASELSDEAVDGWRAALTDAWRILTLDHPAAAEDLAAGLVSLVPLLDPKDGRGVSATAVNAFGAAAMTPPVSGSTLAVALIHEFQHSKLSALLDMVPLYQEASTTLLYAPWRDDPRPLAGLLQGVYAYLGVTSFWARHRHQVEAGESAFAHFQFALWREQASRAAKVIADSGVLTGAGHRFVAGMRDVLARWASDPVPPASLFAAHEAAVDHWLIWRLRNLRPDPEAVTELADTWLAGAFRPNGPVPSTQPMPGRFAPVPNGRLARLHLRLRARADGDRSGDAAPATPGQRDLERADINYVDGHYAAAAHGYRNALDRDPEAAYAWAGLALSLRHVDAGRLTDAPLGHRPELVAAVHRAIRERTGHMADPLVLSDWLAGLKSPTAD